MKKEEPKTVEITEEPTIVSDKQDPALSQLADKLAVFKERGNLHLKKKAYKEAVKSFSEGINQYEAAGKPSTDEDLKTKAAQLYTNRSLAFHNLNQQSSAFNDANFVLEHLDTVNQKALFRRAHSFKTQGKWEEATRDLQLLMKEGPTDAIKADLDHCLAKFMEQRKNAPKVSEVKTDGFKKVQI